MNLIVTTPGGEFYTVEVSGEMEVENLFALVAMESGKSAQQIQVRGNSPNHSSQLIL